MGIGSTTNKVQSLLEGLLTSKFKNTVPSGSFCAGMRLFCECMRLFHTYAGIFCGSIERCCGRLQEKKSATVESLVDFKIQVPSGSFVEVWGSFADVCGSSIQTSGCFADVQSTTRALLWRLTAKKVQPPLEALLTQDSSSLRLFCGGMRLFCRYIRLFHNCIGLSGGFIGHFCGDLQQRNSSHWLKACWYSSILGLFCECIRLFCGCIGHFCGDLPQRKFSHCWKACRFFSILALLCECIGLFCKCIGHFSGDLPQRKSSHYQTPFDDFEIPEKSIRLLWRCIGLVCVKLPQRKCDHYWTPCWHAYSSTL